MYLFLINNYFIFSALVQIWLKLQNDKSQRANKNAPTVPLILALQWDKCVLTQRYIPPDGETVPFLDLLIEFEIPSNLN